MKLTATLNGNVTDSKTRYKYINVLPDTTELDSVIGPDSVCQGATVYFDVPQVYGVSYYEWQLPPGGQIINGQGTQTIEATFLTAGGTVRCRANYACGKTDWVSKTVDVKTPVFDAVLMVTGDQTYTAADTDLDNALTARGYNVTPMPDDVVQGSNAECAGLIVVSPSVDAADLNFKLREIAVPTLVLEDSSFVYFNMTNGSAGIDYGTEASEQEIELIEDPALPTAHPISQLGFTQGDLLEVHGSGDLTQWGEPRRDGVTILSVDGDPAKATVFAYEQGNTMPGLLIAPERRVGGWLDVNTLGNPGTETDTILDRMLCWLSRNCPSDREIYTNDVEDVAGPATTYCAGDSIYINYTKTGQFLGVVPNIADPIYTREVDNSYDIGEFNSDGTLRMILQGTDWLETKAGGPFIDTSYLDDNDAGSLHMAIMRPEILATGEYDVRVHVPDPGYGPGDTVTADAEVTINHADGTTVAYLDQRTSTGYISVGTYRFEKGTDGTVIISNFNSKDRPDMHTLVDAVQFSPISLQPEGNVFTAQLSNSVGTFASFRELGSIMDTAAGTIAGVIPEDVATGTQYRVRVTSSLPSITGDLNDNGTITITGEPQKPGPISGPAVACQNQSVYTYRVNTVPGVSHYVWTRPLGTTFQGQPSSVTELEVAAPDTTVTIDFGTSTGGILKVRTKNQCETSNNVDGFSSLNISLFSNPPVAPTAIGGKDTVCQLDTVTYAATHPNPSVVQSWRWILPTGAAVLGPDTLGTITLEFTGSPEPSTEQIGAYAIDACGDEGDTLYRDILIDNTLAAPSTGPITMTDGTCSGEKIFSVTPVPGATNYAWTLPGGSILNGAGTNTLEVVFQDPVSGNVEVQVTSPCGTDPTPSSLAINITDTSNFDFELAGGQDTLEGCGPIILSASGYSFYTWSTGSTDPSIIANNTGTYWVIVGDNNGCTGSDTVEIVSSNPAVPNAQDTTVGLSACGGISLDVSTEGSTGYYYWYDSPTGGTPFDSVQYARVTDITGDTSVYVSSWQFGNPAPSDYISFDSDERGREMIDLDCANPIESGQEVTFQTWFRVQEAGDHQGRSLVSTRDGVNFEMGIGMYGATSGRLGMSIDTDGGRLQFGGNTLVNDGLWHHATFVYDNGTASIYVDGVLDATSSLGTNYSFDGGTFFSIGGRRSNGGPDYFAFYGGNNGTYIQDNDIANPFQPGNFTTEDILGAHHSNREYEGYFVGTNGMAYRLDDGPVQIMGYNLTDISPGGVDLHDVYWDRGNGVWVVGQGGNILYSNDNGSTTWISQASTVVVDLNGIHASNGNTTHLYAVGDNGRVLTTINGGATWNAATVGGSTNWNSVYAVDDTTAAIVGDNGEFRYTLDGGTTWNNPVSAPTTGDNLNDIHGDGLEIMVVGDNGTVWNSTDGVNYSAAAPGYTGADNLNAVDMVNGTDGFVVGDNGTALFTFNRGDNFVPFTGTTSEDLNAVMFSDYVTTWFGDMDEVAFWNGALSASEVADGYGDCVNPLANGLVSYFNCDNNVNDVMGNMTCASLPWAGYETGDGPTVACAKCESTRDTLTVSIDPLQTGEVETQDYLVCTAGGEDVTITANGGSGQFKWYRTATGGTPFDTLSNSINVSSVQGDSTFYVSSYAFSAFRTSDYLDADFRSQSGNSYSNCQSLGNEFTFEAWLQFADPGLTYILTEESSRNLEINQTAGNKIRWHTSDGANSGTLISNAAINDGVWHHLACTFNRGEMSIYIDGRLDTTNTFSNTTYSISCGDLYFFDDDNSDGEDYSGNIDEIRVWDIARTEADIRDNRYQCVPVSSGLRDWWRFEGGALTSETGNHTLNTPAYGTWNFVSGGLDFACGLCESDRDTIEISYDPSIEVQTNPLTSTSNCLDGQIQVPFTVCPSAPLCDAIDTTLYDFNDGVVDADFNLADWGKNPGDATHSESGGSFYVEKSGTSHRMQWDYNQRNEFCAGLLEDVTGDFEAVVNVRGMSGTTGDARVGIYLMNDRLNKGAGGLGYVAVDDGGRIRMELDTDNDGKTGDEGEKSGTVNTFPNVWLKLERIGNDFTAYTSNTGAAGSWTNEFTLTMTSANAAMDVGLGVTPDDGSSGATISGEFDDFMLIQGGAPDPRDYQFTVEFSDDGGSFAGGTTFGADTITYTGDDVCPTLSSVVNTSVPNSLTVGGTYAVRVHQINPDGSTVTGSVSPNTFTVPTNVWTGAVNRTWQNDGNWTCGVPTKFENALIPSTANHPIVDGDSGAVYVHNIHLNQGASLTFLNGSETYVYGDVFADSAGSAVLTNGPHSLYMYGESGVEQDLYVRQRLFNLEIDNPDGVRVYHDMELLGDLNMVDGNLVLDEYDLDMCNGGGAIVGGGPASYIEQNAAKGSDGYIRMSVPVGTQLTYPIGVNGGTYTPAHLRNSGSAARCYEVRVFDNVYEYGMGAATRTFGDSIVDKTWEITPLPEAGASLDLTLQWNDADERANFAANRYIGYIAKNIHVGTSPWLHIPSSLGTVSGASEPYQATATGITTFSTFMVANVQVPLPVELLSFTAMNVEGNGQLSWITAEEEGLKGFDVLKSTDGEHFEQIAWVEAQGSSVTKKDYQLMDYNLTERSYYKLRLVDEDGSVEYSQVRAVDVEEKAGEFQLYPNPVHDNVVTLNYTGSMDFDEEVRLRITNSVGQHVATYEGTVFELQQRLNDDLSKLANAVYNLKFMREGEEQPQVVQLVVQKPMDN